MTIEEGKRLMTAAKLAIRAAKLAARAPRPAGSDAEILYLELATLSALLDAMMRESLRF